jgi:hypothetical protein
MRDYGTAAKRLEHALAQYPDGMWALRGRMMLARCYWQEAHIKGQLLQNARDGVVKLREEERLRYENQQSESLQKALEQYTKVEGPLRARWGAGDRLSAEEATYLKNASFWGADCYLYMKKFEEAARLYSILALRYQQLPEELLARYQISIIYVSYLSQLDKATEEVGRFRAAFDKVPESAYDGSTEAHVRSFWVQKLDEVTKGLKALKDAAKAPAPK